MAADKEISKHKKKKPDLQKRPFALVYFIALFVIRIMCKLQFNFSYKGDKVKGPALILSNHTSNEDWKFVGVANPNTRISFFIT